MTDVIENHLYRKLENEDREKTATIERLKTRLDQADHSLALTTVSLSEIDLSNSQSKSTTSSNGILLWKIEGIAHKWQEAVNGT